MMPLSLLIAGPVTDQLGIRFWYIFGGTICILMAIAATFNSSIMHIEENHLDSQPASPASVSD